MVHRPGKKDRVPTGIGTGNGAGSGGQELADGEGRDRERRERQRLATLREYRILDTDAEEAFDRVTKLVADLFDAPIALISFVDGSRHWFKSVVGLPIREIQIDANFCQRVIEERGPFVVPDTLADPCFRDGILVTQPPFARFYAGVPLIAYNGEILGTLCILGPEPRPIPDAKALARLRDFADIVMAEAELRRTVLERNDARRMLERALDFSGTATWQYDPRTDALHWRGATAELWGADFATALATGEGFLGRVHPDDRDRTRAALEAAVAGGTPYAAEYRVQHPERGVRWIAARADWDVQSSDAMLTGIGIDITEQKSRQENTNLLMRELHHRMRNLFATVGAIISLTRHAASDVDDYVERIGNRLDALNRAQNVLLSANFMTGSMHALLREVEAAFPRIRWSGPDLLLPENALVAMALVFNELATNAVKHGALATETGRVDVRWSQDDADVEARRLRLVWTESGGVGRTTVPDRTSFGTLLMERSVRNNLGGTIERRWAPSGLVCEITLPARWREA